MAIRTRLIAAIVCTNGFILGGPVDADQPALTVDLRAVSTTSGSIVDPKHVLFTGSVGDTITMDVWSDIPDI